MIEFLEQRKLLAAELGLDGVLSVSGTADDDSIKLHLASGDIVVEQGSGQQSFPASEVHSIQIDGGDGADLIQLDSDIPASLLQGGPGNDTLVGGDGDDTLDGGGGNDSLDGKGGADVFIGGAGFDSADYRSRTEDLLIRINGNADDGANSGAEGDDVHADVERIFGGAGNDRIVGGDDDDSLNGREGDDTILGGIGKDSIDGGDGDDSLDGQAGDDRLTGGAGRDTMLGDDGDDTFLAQDGQRDTVDGGAGSNTAESADGASLDTLLNVVVPAPEITVFRAASELTDGQSSIDFGTVTQGDDGPTRTFTVRNDGTEALTISGIDLPAGFSLTQTLAASIGPGASDTFVVKLNSATVGGKSGQMRIHSNDADEEPFRVDLSGAVEAQPPVLTPEITVFRAASELTDGQSSLDFGTVTQGDAGPTRTFTVRNDGTVALTISGIDLPAGFSLTQTLAASIAPGASDTFVVRLNSAAVGPKSGQMRIHSNDADEDPFRVDLSGSVEAQPPVLKPEITVFRAASELTGGQSSIDFGTVTQGDDGPTRTFTVRNDGTAALSISGIDLPAGFSLAQSISASILPGNSDTFTVKLDSAAVGSKSGQMRIQNSDEDEGPFRVDLSGAVEAPPVLKPEVAVFRAATELEDGQSSIDFGTASEADADAPQRTFTITNQGNATLTLGALTVPAGFLIVDDLVASLAAGDSDTVVIALDTTDPGEYSGTVRFNNNDDDEDPFTFAVTGSVQAKPVEITVLLDGNELTDNQGTVDFGTVFQGDEGPTRTFTVRNDGSGVMRLGDIELPDGFSLIEGLDSRLRAGESDTFTVSLDTQTIGASSGKLRFTTNDADEGPFRINVSGEVRKRPAPEITVTRGKAHVFDGKSTITVGKAEFKHKGKLARFTVLNEGDAPLTLGTLTLPAGFILLDGLASSLDPGASDTFTVRMDTKSPGLHVGQVSFDTNDANEGAFQFNLRATVTAADLAIFDGKTPVAPGSGKPVNFGTLEAGVPGKVKTFRLVNRGDAPLHMGKITLPSGYSVARAPKKLLAPGAAGALGVRLNAGAAGIHAGQVVVNSNDAGGPFGFAVTGLVKGVGAVMQASALVVTGTAAADSITLSGSGANITVLANGVTLGTFNAAQRIIINAGGGDDTVSMPTVSLPAVIDGGAGNDRLTGGGAADDIRGGLGDDRLTGGFGADILSGQDGNDILDAVDGTPDKKVDGGPGNDTVRADPTDSKSGT